MRARIDGDERLGPEGRFAIYAGGYRSRLSETLREDYPALRLLVGDTVFDLFAAWLYRRPPAAPFQPLRLWRPFRRPSRRDPPAADGGPLAACRRRWRGSSGPVRRCSAPRDWSAAERRP